MEKKHFVLKLNPSRNDFAQTMTEEEKSIMQQHVEYCKNYMDDEQILVFGPVMDPNGIYGLAIMSVTDEEQVREFIKNDPASRLNNYEYFPMMAIVPESKLNS